MKKYILISSIVASVLIGCGGGDSNKDSQNSNQTTSEVTNEFKFTPDFLNGKTFYLISSRKDNSVEVTPLSFNETKVKMKKGEIGYTIENGIIKVKFAENAIGTMEPISKDNERINIKSIKPDGSSMTTYFFFKKENADTFVKQHNDNLKK